MPRNTMTTCDCCGAKIPLTPIELRFPGGRVEYFCSTGCALAWLKKATTP